MLAFVLGMLVGLAAMWMYGRAQFVAPGYQAG